MMAGSSNPRIPGSPPMSVTGTARNPSAISSSYAWSSVSTLLTVNGTPIRESNSFTRSQGRQPSPANTMTGGCVIS